jgi:hypothetical protein
MKNNSYRELHMMKTPQRKEAHIISVLYVASFPLSTFPDLPILYEMRNTTMLKKRTPTIIMRSPTPSIICESLQSPYQKAGTSKNKGLILKNDVKMPFI